MYRFVIKNSIYYFKTNTKRKLKQNNDELNTKVKKTLNTTSEKVEQHCRVDDLPKAKEKEQSYLSLTRNIKEPKFKKILQKKKETEKIKPINNTQIPINL